MNLLDVIPVTTTKAVPASKELRDAHLLARQAVMSTAETLSRVWKTDRSIDLTKILASVAKLENDRVDVAMTDFFKKHGRLPSDLAYDHVRAPRYSDELMPTTDTNNWLSKFSDTPRITAEGVKQIAADANMIIIPFDYLDPRSYSNADYYLRQSINGFRKASKDGGMTAYVVAPLRQYSILQHLKADDVNLDIIANAYQANFDVLGMMMPAMLMFSDRLTNVEGGLQQMYKNINTLDANLKGIVRGMEAMEKKLADISSKLEIQQQELIANRLRQAALEKELAAAQTRSSSWFAINDPLMFAVPNGETVTTAKDFYVGPCWGPDFDELLAKGLELKFKKGQRNKLANTVQQNFC